MAFGKWQLADGMVPKTPLRYNINLIVCTQYIPNAYYKLALL